MAVTRAMLAALAVTAAFLDWQHPRDRRGRFIEVGASVNVTPRGGGPEARATVTDLSPEGVEVTYANGGGVEVVPSGSLEVAAEAVATLNLPSTVSAPADQGSTPRRVPTPMPMPDGPAPAGDTRVFTAEELGMKYDPANAERADVKMARSGAVNWDAVPTVDYPMGNVLHATEDEMKRKHIEKIQLGEPLREGYDPQVLRTDDGDFVVDGHHRVGMYVALGRDTMPTKVLDIRTQAKEPIPNVPPVTRGPDGKIIPSAEAMQIGSAIYADAVRREPDLSAQLAGLVGDTAPGQYTEPTPGGAGKLYGFEYRLKKEAGLQEKIERVVEEKQVSRTEAALDIKDAVRYTIHLPDDDDFGRRAQEMVDALSRDGGSVKAKNTWPPPPRGTYRGLNLQVSTADGYRYEVQVSTARAQRVKDLSHEYYEEQRLTVPGSPEYAALEQKMIDVYASLETPTGAHLVG